MSFCLNLTQKCTFIAFSSGKLDHPLFHFFVSGFFGIFEHSEDLDRGIDMLSC